MTCDRCIHHREHKYVKHGVCNHPKAYRPMGELPACQVVWGRTGGRCFEVKK